VGASDELQLTVIKSKYGNTYKLEIVGKVGRIQVRGHTDPVYLGLDSINSRLANDVTHTFRADGSGKEVPFSVKNKVVSAVLSKLLEVDLEFC